MASLLPVSLHELCRSAYLGNYTTYGPRGCPRLRFALAGRIRTCQGRINEKQARSIGCVPWRYLVSACEVKAHLIGYWQYLGAVCVW